MNSFKRWTIEKACCNGVPKELTEKIKERYEFFLRRSDINNIENGKWEKEDDFGKRITVLTKDITNNQTFRSEILCPFNIDIVKEYVNNQKQRLNNRGRIKSFGFVRNISEQVKVEGVHIKGIWPMSDRYVSNYWCEFYNHTGHYVQISFDTPSDEFEKKGAVRIRVFLSAWLQIPEGNNATRIIHFQEGDADIGSVPKWAVKKGMHDSMILPLKILELQEAGKVLEKPSK